MLKALGSKISLVVVLGLFLTVMLYQNCGPSRPNANQASHQGDAPSKLLSGDNHLRVDVLNGAGAQVPFGSSTCVGGASEAQSKVVGINMSAHFDVLTFRCRRSGAIVDANAWDCSEAKKLVESGSEGAMTSTSESLNRRLTIEYSNLPAGQYSLLVQADYQHEGSLKSTEISEVSFVVDSCQ